MSNLDNLIWSEKYRPKTIQECILPEITKKMLQGNLDSGKVPHYLFTGSAGTGKCLDPNELIEIFVSDELYLKLIS